MCSFYAKCEGYADNGEETIPFEFDLGGHKQRRLVRSVFETTFVRGRLFSFKWRRSGLTPQHEERALSIEFDAISVSHSVGNCIHKFTTVDSAVAAFGRASLVASLLLESRAGRNWMKLPLTFSFGGESPVHGIECAGRG